VETHSLLLALHSPLLAELLEAAGPQAALSVPCTAANIRALMAHLQGEQGPGEEAELAAKLLGVSLKGTMLKALLKVEETTFEESPLTEQGKWGVDPSGLNKESPSLTTDLQCELSKTVTYYESDSYRPGGSNNIKEEVIHVQEEELSVIDPKSEPGDYDPFYDENDDSLEYEPANKKIKKSKWCNGSMVQRKDGTMVQKKKVKPKLPTGPFVLDEKRLDEIYTVQPEHIEIIKNLPRIEEELIVYVEGKVSGSKNAKFVELLWNSNDVFATVAAFKLTKEEYEQKYEDPFKETATNQSPDKSSKIVKSDAWINQLNWTYNTWASFIAENPEFLCLDWTTAKAEEIDIVVGYFWVWLAPQEGGGSLGGTRFTSGSLKQIKTKLQNLFVHMLKRKDINLSDHVMEFSRNMYEMKRGMTHEVVAVEGGNAGDRKRVALDDVDREKLENWTTKPLNKILDPEELLFKVAIILLKQTVGHGSALITTIRRHHVLLEMDKSGRKFVRLKGTVKKSSTEKAYQQVDVTISSEFEVSLIEKLLHHLPPVGCKECPEPSLPSTPACTCDDLFLQSLPSSSWRPDHLEWFSRSRRGHAWFHDIMAQVSHRAGLSRKYTNSCMRSTFMNQLSAAGCSIRQATRQATWQPGGL